MAKSVLDEGGTDEVASMRRRVLRDASMGRILKSDADYLVELCDKMDARIVRMKTNRMQRRNY